MLQHAILEDILREKGVMNEESLEDYDERLISLIEKWNEIAKNHIFHRERWKFLDAF